MDVGSISPVGSQRLGHAVSTNEPRPKAAQTSTPMPTDTAEISPEAKAYQNKKTEESPQYKNLVAQLSRTQNEVLAHEQAHMAAGGSFAGAASYSYTVGPDGKRYITGGEVPISMPSSDDKERMLKQLEQVKKAALAPAEPSSQDLSVAAQAGAEAMKLKGEIAAEK